MNNNKKQNNIRGELSEHEIVMPVMPNPEQMCCICCGHIAKIGDRYKIERPDGEGHSDFPVCPKCGEWNTGGYSTYDIADVWTEEDMKTIIELNQSGA